MSEEKKFERIYGDYFKIIQGVINRMSKNSFLIKAWTITLISAILVLTLSLLNIFVLGILIGISVIFWGLDSYYLRLERIYRKFYGEKVNKYNDKVTRKDLELFSMDIDKLRGEEEGILKIMRSNSEIYFYLTIIGALSIFFVYSTILLFI
ncbi:hypothetical protein ES705_41000 [subsurface metagenome]